MPGSPKPRRTRRLRSRNNRPTPRRRGLRGTRRSNRLALGLKFKLLKQRPIRPVRLPQAKAAQKVTEEQAALAAKQAESARQNSWPRYKAR